MKSPLILRYIDPIFCLIILPAMIVLTLLPMKDMMDLLPSDRFTRIHRSYIVAMQKVESFGSKRVVMRGIDGVLPIGRTYLKDNRGMLG